MELISKIRELVVALRAEDWKTSVTLTLAIIQMIVAGMSEAPQVRMMNDGSTDAPSADELEALASRTQGPLLNLLLPKMLALLLKLLAGV